LPDTLRVEDVWTREMLYHQCIFSMCH